MQPIENHATVNPGPWPLPWRRALLLGAGVAGLIALTASAQIYLSMLHHGHSLARIVAWQLCSWSVWAAATPLVLRLGAQLSDRITPVPSRAFSVASTALAIMCVHVLIASTVWFQPYVPVHWRALSSTRYGSRSNRIFLFNTLNSIASLIRARAGDRALSMLLGLSELLRATVDGTREHTTTLAVEAAFVKKYIELQRVRFSDRLDVRYDMSPESEACAVRSFRLGCADP